MTTFSISIKGREPGIDRREEGVKSIAPGRRRGPVYARERDRTRNTNTGSTPREIARLIE